MISFFKWVREKNTQSDEIDDEGEKVQQKED